MSDASTIVQRLWNYCNILKDDGVSYSEYVEQLTYLLFLKMEDENSNSSKISTLPDGFDWKSLTKIGVASIENHYDRLFTMLGDAKGLVGQIFRKAQNKIQDPAKLKRLITLIDGETLSLIHI